MDRDARFAAKVSGNGVQSTSRTNAEITRALDRAIDKISEMAKTGATAKDMAVELRYVAMMTLAQSLSGEDQRLANDAAKELLIRSDGRASTDTPPQQTNINILNVSRDDLARKLAFLEQLKKNKSNEQPDANQLILEPIDADINI